MGTVLKAALLIAVSVLLGFVRRRLMRPFAQGDSDRRVIGALLIFPFMLIFLPLADVLGVVSNGYIVIPAGVLHVVIPELPGWRRRSNEQS